MRPWLYSWKKMTLYSDLPPPRRAHAATARRLAVQGKAALSPNLARPFTNPQEGPRPNMWKNLVRVLELLLARAGTPHSAELFSA